MRIPWISTIDALVDELNQYLDETMPLISTALGTVESTGGEIAKPRGLSGLAEFKKLIEETEDRDQEVKTVLRAAILKLLEIRSVLASASLYKSDSIGMDSRVFHEKFLSLNQLDDSQIRFPEVSGKEALSKYVAQGGLFGPILGAHIANAILSKPTFRPRTPTTFDEDWNRRFAVKQVSTIRHLWAVGNPIAIRMYCDQYILDDPDASAQARILQWVKRDSREAKKKLNTVVLSARDQNHFRAVLLGLHPDKPKGMLKGEPYPSALMCLNRARFAGG